MLKIRLNSKQFNNEFYKMDFELLYRKTFNRKGLAKYLDVSERTIKRWEKTNKPPGHIVKLIKLLNNDLSHLGEEWTGFRFVNNRLYTPENEPVQAAHIRAIKYNRMTIDFLRAEKEKPVFHEINLKSKKECKVLNIISR